MSTEVGLPGNLRLIRRNVGPGEMVFDVVDDTTRLILTMDSRNAAALAGALSALLPTQATPPPRRCSDHAGHHRCGLNEHHSGPHEVPLPGGEYLVWHRERR